MIPFLPFSTFFLYLCQYDEVPFSQWKSIKLQSLQIGRNGQTLSQSFAQLECDVFRAKGWDLLPVDRLIVPSIWNRRYAELASHTLLKLRSLSDDVLSLFSALPASPEPRLVWYVLLMAMWWRCLLMEIELKMGCQSSSFTLSPLKSRIPLSRFIVTAGWGTDSCLAQANS